MNIVLLGANGYVGRAIMRAAIACPQHVQVWAQARTTDDLQTAHNVRLFKGSLEQVHPELFPNVPHVLIHAAGKNIDHDGSGYHHTNVEGTRQLLSSCNAHTLGVLYHSSLSVLGQHRQQQVSNTARRAPGTALARSRAAAEALVLEYCKQHAINGYCLRPRFIFGKDDAFVMPALIRLAAKGTYIGDGRQQYSIIDVDDYAKLMLELGRRIDTQALPCEQIPLNMGYQQPLSFASMFSTLQGLQPGTGIKRRIPYPAALATACNLLPFQKLKSLATQLQLIGLDHYSDISETRSRLHDDILCRDSLEYFRELAQHFKESSCN